MAARRKPTFTIESREENLNYGRLDLGKGRYVARRWTVRGVHQGSGLRLEIDVWVDKAGNPRCRAVRFEPESLDHDLTTSAIRKVPVGELVNENFAAAIHGMDPKAKGDLIRSRVELSDEERALAHPKGALRSKQRKPLTDDELEQITKVYRAAVTNGLAPTKRLADVMHVDRSTARRWVARVSAASSIQQIDSISLRAPSRPAAGSSPSLRTPGRASGRGGSCASPARRQSAALPHPGSTVPVAGSLAPLGADPARHGSRLAPPYALVGRWAVTSRERTEKKGAAP